MADDFFYSVIPYAGNEETILEVRNRNRRITQSRAYMDWRFTEPNSPCAPIVFFIKTAAEKIIGMTAVIWRQYHIDGSPIFLPVLGDISLDDAYRGQGLATKLFSFIAEYGRQKNLPGWFVMPNEAAAKRLNSAGWHTIGRIAPYVCVLDSTGKFKKILRLQLFATVASALSKVVLKAIIRSHRERSIITKDVAGFDHEFEVFWQKFPRKNIILRDRSLAALKWRYSDQPGTRYSIQKFYHQNEFVGYAVLDCFSEPGDCLICEFLVIDRDLEKSCLAQLLEKLMADPAIRTVRTIVIEDSETARMTKKFGFLKRSPVTTFQIYNAPPKTLDPALWFITAGDKDA